MSSSLTASMRSSQSTSQSSQIQPEQTKQEETGILSRFSLEGLYSIKNISNAVKDMGFLGSMAAVGYGVYSGQKILYTALSIIPFGLQFLSTYITDRVEKEYEKRLLAMNQNTDLPLCLIISGTKDRAMLLTDYIDVSPSIAKNYKYQRCEVSRGRQLPGVFQKYLKPDEKLGILWINSHGEHDHLALGEPSDEYCDDVMFMSEIHNLKDIFNRHMDENTLSIINSCRSAKGEENFTKEFSKYAPGKVVGANGYQACSAIINKDKSIKIRSLFGNVARTYQHGKEVPN